jgi:hypothetical protein
MQVEFLRVVGKFARWRRQFYERTYPNTGPTWLEPFPDRVEALAEDMSYEEKEMQKLEWRREAVLAAKLWLYQHPFTESYTNYEDESTFRKNLWLISMSGEDYFVPLPGYRNIFMFPSTLIAPFFWRIYCDYESYLPPPPPAPCARAGGGGRGVAEAELTVPKRRYI